MQTLFRITIQLLFLGLGITDAVAQPGQAYFDPPAGYKPEFRRERNHELIREEQRLIMESDGVKQILLLTIVLKSIIFLGWRIF